MTALILILIFIGSICFYNTSKKAVLNNSPVERWLQINTKKSKILGGLSYIVALIISLKNFGITSGIFYWVLLISIIVCLIIIFNPTKKINYKHLIIGTVVLIIIQFI